MADKKLQRGYSGLNKPLITHIYISDLHYLQLMVSRSLH